MFTSQKINTDPSSTTTPNPILEAFRTMCKSMVENFGVDTSGLSAKIAQRWVDPKHHYIGGEPVDGCDFHRLTSLSEVVTQAHVGHARKVLQRLATPRA